MKNKIKIGVIFGGRSGEHEVSLVSASSVIKALDKKKYQIIQIGIGKDGRWIFGNSAMTILKNKKRFLNKTFKGVLPDPTIKSVADVFFPVLHGPFGEDGTIQGLFEMAGVPYVGSGVLGSAVGMDKIIQNQLFDKAGLKQAKYFWFLGKGWPKSSASVKKQARELLTFNT